MIEEASVRLFERRMSDGEKRISQDERAHQPQLTQLCQREFRSSGEFRGLMRLLTVARETLWPAVRPERCGMTVR